jgi:mono/diheme cytochrome c family protein
MINGRVVRLTAIGLAALFVVAQLVPYGRAHKDPKPTRQVRFASASTQRLFDGACADCHSDHTSWPLYSKVAPSSWLVQNDVDGGRRAMNLSEWDHPQPDPGEVEGVITRGGMPPLQYKLIHGGARLSDAERRRLASGFRALFAAHPPG